VYKLLLCWRYLRTRFLALVCIVSVMLGVATLIVVNSVMSGFSTKLRDRLHALLSDVVIEAPSFDGFGNPGGKMDLIRNDPFLRERIVAMTPTLEIFAMFQYRFRGEPLARPIRLVGVDFEGRSAMGGFKDYLVSEHPGPKPTFELSDEALRRYQDHERNQSGFHLRDALPKAELGGPAVPAPPPEIEDAPVSALVGWAIVHFRRPDAKPDDLDKEVCTLHPGDEAVITTLSGERLLPVHYRYAISGYFRAEMSEQDANYVFVPLEHLQRLRTMGDRVTSIQIKLRDYDKDAKAVVKRLQELFYGLPLEIQTWEDKQGPLLAAIGVEKGILNVLLFMIVGVAGFGILAIFSMIVVEKTRDIGILKALGASNIGIMKIFLGYGLLLGVVGAGLGTAMGLTITWKINDIHHLLGKLTGHEIFDGSVYYFSEIPTNIVPLMLILVNLGAVLIAVAFSVLPALRAAMLHPVRALRYE
jgi:lipoprotein-releasing system permease protein